MTLSGPIDCGIGARLPRLEDLTLLTGRGRFGDDLGSVPGTLHAAILRSPHAHAAIRDIKTTEAEKLPGVHRVILGSDFAALSKPLLAVLRVSMDVRPCAVDRVRYVGEPVAMVLAADRYIAEDALDLIEVDYQLLAPVVDVERSILPEAPCLHEGIESNTVSDRHFRYGDPETAFSDADRIVELTIRYPRNSCTPLEGYVVSAEFDPGSESFTIRSNFQGPFSLHPVMARSLGVPEGKLRLLTYQNSGGSFGVKQAIFPMVVLCGLAARLSGRPVSWIEDRLEHLTAASSATNRVTHVRAAVRSDGELLGLDIDQIDDVGAYLRAPEPASLYRMHGNLSGAYRVRNIVCRSRVVVTNKTPTGLNRGFGGPQHYFALERLMQRIAVELGMEPVEVIRRNLVPEEAFPYRSPAGALLDSGRYDTLLGKVWTDEVRADLEARKARAEAEGKLYGIGFAAVVEPSVSNMGYITNALTAEQRAKAGPKGGALAHARVSIGPTGGVTVAADGVPQGQGHQTVLAQVVADAFGIDAGEVSVASEFDTLKDPWTIAAGNYASRFAGAVAGAASLAAAHLRERLAEIAASQLNCAPSDIVFEAGQIGARDNPDNRIPFQRLAGLAHWSPGELPERVPQGLSATAHWSPPELAPPSEADEINSSLAYGFVFDLCALEIDPVTGASRIDRYITGHDAGRLLNPMLADGQVYGAFAHGVGAALLEEFEYGEDGAFLSGSFADYLLPTTCEVPKPEIVHLETPSPFTPLGAKGLGEGNCMSTPVAIANAAADALGLVDIELPLTRARVHALLTAGVAEPGGSQPVSPAQPSIAGGRQVVGEGEASIALSPEEAWRTLLSPETLASVIPGCRKLETPSPDLFTGQVRIGIGAVRGDYTFEVALKDLDPPRSVRLVGKGGGSLGGGGGEGTLILSDNGEGGTLLRYSYRLEVSGKVAAVGGRMLDAASRMLARQFFEALARRTGGPVQAAESGLWDRILRLLGIGG